MLCHRLLFLSLFLLLVLLPSPASAINPAAADLAVLSTERTGMENALWIETPPDRRFDTTTRVVCAELTGPAEITMIHFAYPHTDIATTRTLGRELLLRIYWDGEATPSVDCPMVDFFCDPAGRREIVDTSLVNKCRGFNAYFPMPFRKSARVELVYDGDRKPDQKLWHDMPCYAYVMYRTRKNLPPTTGYFHAQWRKQLLLVGKQDYVAMEAKGHGKFIGWNVTMRRPGMNSYPVDMNEKFYIDGETTPSIEMQGIEDSFGYSWGFPARENMFPLTGWFPHLEGAAAYRFFLSDAMNFQESLRVLIGFGVDEHGFKHEYAIPGAELELSSTCYWYQQEPHAEFPKMLSPAEREPCPSKKFWPHSEQLPDRDELTSRGVRLLMLCGHPDNQQFHAEPGFGVEAVQGFTYTGFPLPVYYCLASEKELQVTLKVPPRAEGMLRIYIIDPDKFQGGREQQLFIGTRDAGKFSGFQEGRWVEVPVTADETASGKLNIHAVNLKQTGNAVISKIEWVRRDK